MSKSFFYDSTKRPVSSQTVIPNHQLPGQHSFVVQTPPQAQPKPTTPEQQERIARLDVGVMRALNLQAKRAIEEGDSLPSKVEPVATQIQEPHYSDDSQESLADKITQDGITSESNPVIQRLKFTWNKTNGVTEEVDTAKSTSAWAAKYLINNFGTITQLNLTKMMEAYSWLCKFRNNQYVIQEANKIRRFIREIIFHRHLDNITLSYMFEGETINQSKKRELNIQQKNAVQKFAQVAEEEILFRNASNALVPFAKLPEPTILYRHPEKTHGISQDIYKYLKTGGQKIEEIQKICGKYYTISGKGDLYQPASTLIKIFANEKKRKIEKLGESSSQTSKDIEEAYNISTSNKKRKFLRNTSRKTSLKLKTYDPGILEIIIPHMDYEALLLFMQASKAIFNKVSIFISKYTIQNLPEIGKEKSLLAHPLYLGMIKIVARYNPSGTLAQEKEQSLDAAEFDDKLMGLTLEIIRALGWRQYSSALRIDKNKCILTLNSFIDEAAQHIANTKKLRAIPFGSMYPQKFFGLGHSTYEGNSGKELRNKHKTKLELLAKYWFKLQKEIGKRRKEKEDELAESVAKKTKQNSRGGNITVEKDTSQKTKGIVYSNNELTSQQIQKLRGMDYRVKFVSNNERKNWSKKQGKDRKTGKYPNLPFHSEMQRTQELEPWQLAYAGNNYHACIQCLVSYYAMGIKKGEGYKGTHGAKAASIIPAKIKENSVYLQYYLGLDLWNTFMKMGPDDIGAFLDLIEREDKGFYKRANIKGPTSYF
ncbi:MAG: hypothetical protein F6K42_04455 [Leptolyngbya sp. SIO1D8]|nr:hypothetical protein [Leptolyngbya sp. SIO1D8]